MTKRWFAGATEEDVIRLAAVEQLNPVDWQAVLRRFPSFRVFQKATETELRSCGLTSHQASSLLNRTQDVEQMVGEMRRYGIRVVTFGDKHYPSLLAEIDDPPLWLFYRGDLAVCDGKLLSIVGSRKPSAYAAAALKELLPTELAAQLVTVSGLAYGVDEAVHRLSLAANGSTIAVLAGGLDRVYPSAHTQLADEIVRSGGLIISEYPPLVRPQPYRFPIRNRIVAGLSAATVIIEARIQSGTLTTARAVVDYNRDLFVLPGRITDEAAQGGNQLIVAGATLLNSPRQIADYFGLTLEIQQAPNLDTPEGQLLNLLTDASYDLDQLVVKTGMTIENLLGLVTRLELSGSIFQDSAGRYSTNIHG
jgi:DNA processing protein